ncbi:MAG: cell division protein FtsQ/DivIB [Pseudomonadota bacterium]
MRQVKAKPKRRAKARPKNRKPAGRPRRTHPKPEGPFLVRIIDRAGERFDEVWENFSPYARVAGGALVLAVAALLWAGGYFAAVGARINVFTAKAAIGAGFAVERITARGLENVTEAEMLAAVGPVEGVSLLHVDLAGARDRVEALGWVEVAAVSRLWPDVLHVSIIERAPAAVWQLNGQMHLIDAEGGVIVPVPADAYPHLPLVVGEGAATAAGEIFALLADYPDIRAETKAMVRVGHRRWNLRLKSGADVKLPEDGVAAALRRLAGAHEANDLLRKPMKYIDLRNAEQAVLGGAPAAVATPVSYGRET